MSTYFERARRALVTLFGALALTVGFAGVAAASADGGTVTNPTGGAQTWFKAYGEHLWVKDSKADGHSAVGLFYVPAVSSYVYGNWVTGGNGTTVDYNYDLPENKDVYYKSCVGESGTGDIFSCNSSYYWAAT